MLRAVCLAIFCHDLFFWKSFIDMVHMQIGKHLHLRYFMNWPNMAYSWTVFVLLYVSPWNYMTLIYCSLFSKSCKLCLCDILRDKTYWKYTSNNIALMNISKIKMLLSFGNHTTVVLPSEWFRYVACSSIRTVSVFNKTLWRTKVIEKYK